MNSLTKKKNKLLKKLRSGNFGSEILAAVSENYDSKEFQLAYSKIKPLMFAGLIGKERETERRITDNIVRGYQYGIEILEVLEDAKLTPKQRSLLELLLYMMASEGLFSQAIQLVSYILVVNHHDLYDPTRMKFAKSYEELNRLSLFVKLQFVEEHGFKFLVDIYDRSLRNCIAHNKYVVEEDGKILNNETNQKIEDIANKGQKLVKLVNTLGLVFMVIDAELIVHMRKSMRGT